MIHPVAMGDAHMECRSLKETVPVLTDLLGLRKSGRWRGERDLKKPEQRMAAGRT